MNHGNNALVYPVIEVPLLKWLNDGPGDVEDDYLGCPECNTDAYLTDYLPFYAKKEPNRSLIEAAIAEYEADPEYQEKHTTAWDSLQHLKALLT